ncbi:MAG: thioredoxin [Thermoleophilia bacterium]|nr:thioredoxin [Thermoleophilia bacterium]
MRSVSDETFEAEVLAAERPVVVDFWAPWCRPCKAIEPLFAQLAAELAGRVEFVRMDVDANPLTAARYGVLALPTAMLFAGGQPRATVAGARPRPDYERAWARWLEAAA